MKIIIGFLILLGAFGVSFADQVNSEVIFPERELSDILLKTKARSKERAIEVKEISEGNKAALESTLFRFLNGLGQQGSCIFSVLRTTDEKGNAFFRLTVNVQGQPDRVNHLYLNDLLKYSEDRRKLRLEILGENPGGYIPKTNIASWTLTARAFFNSPISKSIDFKYMLSKTKPRKVTDVSFSTSVQSPEVYEISREIHEKFKQVSAALLQEKKEHDASERDFDQIACRARLKKIREISKWYAPFINGCEQSNLIVFETGESKRRNIMSEEYILKQQLKNRHLLDEVTCSTVGESRTGSLQEKAKSSGNQ